MKSKKIRLLLPSLIVASIMLLLIMGLSNKDSINQQSMTPKPVPAFQLNGLKSKQKLTESIFNKTNHSQYTLLNVWASWCAICKTEHAFLLQLAEQGIDIVGLNYRDKKPAALSVLKKTNDPYQQVIFDPEGALALDLGVVGTPETYLINNKGMIVARFNGVLNEQIWVDIFEQKIKQLSNTEEQT